MLCSLKSANILLDRHHCAQIADVGLSKTLTSMHDHRLATCMATDEWGTFAWSAPEVRHLRCRQPCMASRSSCLPIRLMFGVHD